MSGRARILAVVAVGVIIAVAFWIAMVRSELKERAERRATGEHEPSGEPASASGSAKSRPSAYDGGRLDKTIADRAVRDALRRKILEAWGKGEGEAAEAAKHGRFEPMPPGPNGEYIDPAYIQDVIRQDMFPMARGCYDELLKRQPDAGGRVEMSFKIVGDDQIGGIVDEVEIDAGAPTAIRDERMNTCIRESLATLAFRPPRGDGVVDIVYPIVFAPGDGDDERGGDR